MKQSTKQLISDLELEIQKSYEQGTSMEAAELLAAKFLQAQMTISTELSIVDLDRRMRKRGLKAIRSAVRIEEVSKHDKKPTEGALEDAVNTDERVSQEESKFDRSEVDRDELARIYDVCREAHIYYRGIAKGRFE